MLGPSAQRMAEQIESLYVLAMSQAASAYGRWHTEDGDAPLELLRRADDRAEDHGGEARRILLHVVQSTWERRTIEPLHNRRKLAYVDSFLIVP